MSGRVASYIARRGLVLYLDAANTKSYPSSGTEWYDLGTGVTTGTLINGPAFNSAFGGYISFDGTNDYVTSALDANSLLNVGSTGTVTVETFIRVNTLLNPFNCIFGCGTEGSLAPSYAVWLNSSYALCVQALTSIISTGITLQASNWYHIAVVFGGTKAVYLNGALINNASINVDTRTEYRYTIGHIGPASTFARYMKGDYRFVRVYNRELTAGEVLEHYKLIGPKFGL